MFRGIANVSLDERGRFAVPTRFRDTLKERSGGKLVVTIDIAHPCLLLYPEQEYQQIEAKLVALDNTQAPIRELQRRFIGFASEVELDANGRVLVANELRDYSGLDRKGVLLGQINKLELWSNTVWRETTRKWPKKPKKGGEEKIEELADVHF